MSMVWRMRALEGLCFGVLWRLVGDVVPVGFVIHEDMRFRADARIRVERARRHYDDVPLSRDARNAAAAAPAERCAEVLRFGQSVLDDQFLATRPAETVDPVKRIGRMSGAPCTAASRAMTVPHRHRRAFHFVCHVGAQATALYDSFLGLDARALHFDRIEARREPL